MKVPKALKPTLELRRSVMKDKISTPIAIPTKAPRSIQPPKKVIKALYDYQAKSPTELSFLKGDFFHVIGDEIVPDWYEACNPATNVRGLVPVSYFQVLEKSSRLSLSDKSDSGTFVSTSSTVPKQQPLYGVVLYDFVAERQDELDAKQGEPIIIIAQSNREWFVAKPIGRLGGPGLIPVTYIEIKDLSTGQTIEDVNELLDRSVVPKVEDWKKMTQDYQDNSITLGRLDFPSENPAIDPKLAPIGMERRAMSTNDEYENMQQSVAIDFDPKLSPITFEFDNRSQQTGLRNSQSLGRYGSSESNQRRSEAFNTSPTSPQLQQNESVNGEDQIMNAWVDKYHFEDDRFWFVVRVQMASGRFRVLYRLYEDFYEFQIALLGEFPVEAGRTGKKRILPFMPGPLSYVNDVITSQRRADLDVYVKELLNLPSYILQNPLLNQLFGMREGDMQTESDSVLDNASINNYETSSSFNTYQDTTQNKQFNGGYNQSQPAYGNVPDEYATYGRSMQPPMEPPPTIKIKIFYKEDVMAIKIPSDITYAALRKRLEERLDGPLASLQYKDETSGQVLRLGDDSDLYRAIRTCPKLLIYADDEHDY
ncbi:4978_t:CDS:1 [Paraglomus brasilianum]|uniref:4978_t:CDS:1 n=1 Tax=Paraglomus brasilianum TaxID=144538 RepID=A0A9N9A1W4_9GLOM|nr:4978_t:CDS:1 [Paraglomus brasilianum]